MAASRRAHPGPRSSPAGTHSPESVGGGTMPMIPHRRQNHRPNGYVLLDSAWAQRLGVQRTGGLYRISRRDLAHRLARLSATLPLADRTHGGIRGLTINEPQRDDIAGLAPDSHVVG